MARANPTSAPPHRPGLGDLIGWGLLLAAVVIALALFTYDRHDLAANAYPPNPAIHNFMGLFGARMAAGLFFLVGAAAYTLPVLLVAFGLAGFVESLRYLRNWRALAGCAGLLVAVSGLLDLTNGWLPALGLQGDTLSAGGLLGWSLNRYVFATFFNRTGASLIYGVLYLVSLLLLTDFHLILWIRRLLHREPRTDAERLAAEEASLRKQAQQIARQQKRLERRAAGLRGGDEATDDDAGEPDDNAGPAGEAVAPAPAPQGLGADMRPIPEPTVRDLSVPQARDIARVVETGETISAAEITASTSGNAAPPASGRTRRPTTAEVLGREPARGGEADGTTDVPEAPDAAGDADGAAATDAGAGGSGEEAEEDDLPAAALPAPRVRMPGRRPKPITVASTPQIGDYTLPSMALLNQPDLTVKPTETKEELMANARLMVQTLAQFGIEVAPGDITKGPTITRYELHPAPGVKLEKIAALTNNMAAALKAERLNILAPVPGKSSVGVEVPNAVKTKVIMRDLLE